MRSARALLFVVLLGHTQGPTNAAEHFNRCDNKIEFEKGERPGAPFFGIGMAFTIYAAAKAKCDPSLPPLTGKIADFVLKSGCDPDTGIFRELVGDAKRVDEAGISGFRDSIEIDSLVEELGGCKKLVESLRDWPN